MPANLENSAVAIGLENVSFHSSPKQGLYKVSFHFNPKKENGKGRFNYCVFVLISNASKVMLKILQAMFQQYVNTRTSRCTSWGFEEVEEPQIKIPNIRWIREKEREFHKNIYFCFIYYDKVFHCVDHNHLWNILKEMGIPYQFSCLLRNLHAGQEATVEQDMERWNGRFVQNWERNTSRLDIVTLLI